MKKNVPHSSDSAVPAGRDRRIRRPFTVSLLLLGVLIIAGGSLVRLILSIQQWRFLVGFSGVLPVYLAASGLIWTLVFLPLFWGLFFRRFWAPRFTRLAVAVYAVAVWLESAVLWLRQALTQGSAFSLKTATPSLGFEIMLSVLLLTFVYWSLSRRNVRDYFGVKS